MQSVSSLIKGNFHHHSHVYYEKVPWFSLLALQVMVKSALQLIRGRCRS